MVQLESRLVMQYLIEIKSTSYGLPERIANAVREWVGRLYQEGQDNGLFPRVNDSQAFILPSEQPYRIDETTAVIVTTEDTPLDKIRSIAKNYDGLPIIIVGESGQLPYGLTGDRFYPVQLDPR